MDHRGSPNLEGLQRPHSAGGGDPRSGVGVVEVLPVANTGSGFLKL